jgi:hypothetical protein
MRFSSLQSEYSGVVEIKKPALIEFAAQTGL